MSINGVILKPNYNQILALNSNEIPFEISTDGLEILKYHSRTSRQNLTITSRDSNLPLKIIANDGYIYLTTKRLVFITASQGDIESFCIDLNLSPVLQLSHKLQAPWFGANYWEFMFFSAANPSIASDGFPKNHYFKGEIKFNDGGLFEFVENLNQVLNDVISNKDIDDHLPSYSEN
ncbi:unnamed protein product [Candida verbasci]|uniref:GRAM domain-containing protein n=1 Tax=Candida verbasci TaxID=1227364 RepID=A0A9W4XC55_9ASCO|nr:unnamed protein product [Candida verbasci]